MRIKNIYTLCLALCGLAVAAACSEGDNDHLIPTPKFEITQSTNIDLSAKGGEATVEFISEGAEIKASVDADWCRIKEITGNKVIVTVDMNAGYPSRTAAIILSDGQTSRKVAVLQQGAVWIYDRNETMLYVRDIAGDVFVETSGTFPIEIDIPEAAKQWIAGEVTDTGFKLSVQENATDSRRTVSFKAKMNNREVEYTVIQCCVADYMGTWEGKTQVIGDDFGISGLFSLAGTTIEKSETEGEYLITVPMDDMLAEGLVMELTAVYDKGEFVVTTPLSQDIGIGNGVNGSVIAADQDGGLYLSADIALVPSIKNGVVTLTYDDAGLFFVIGFFKGSSYQGHPILFPVFTMQKSLK